MQSDYEKIMEAANWIRNALGFKQNEAVANVGIVLGSGLGPFADRIFEESKQAIAYQSIPHFPKSSTEGHASRFVFGKISGKPVLIMQGRVHRYEGYTANEVTFPIRVFAALGIKKLILTNAAGGLGDHVNEGDLMLISDHINFTGDNPLIGPNEGRLGPRFFDMGDCYNKSLRDIAKDCANSLDIVLKEGVYLGVLGPCYETHAEVRFFKSIGADAVGMSTVLEAIVARHAGLELVGISCCTNKAAGLSKNTLTHEEVTEVAAKASDRFSRLLFMLVSKLDT